MKGHGEQTPETASGGVMDKIAASKRLEQADLLLSQLRMDLRAGRVPVGQTAEQSATLARAMAVLDAYVGFMYPTGPHP